MTGLRIVHFKLDRTYGIQWGDQILWVVNTRVEAEAMLAELRNWNW